MSTLLRRVVLGIATVAIAAVTLVSTSTPAQADSAVLMSPKGEATILIGPEDARWFGITGGHTCDLLTWDLNARRQSMGLSLGVSTPTCFFMVQSCLEVLIGSQIAVYVDTDNDYVCIRVREH